METSYGMVVLRSEGQIFGTEDHSPPTYVIPFSTTILDCFNQLASMDPSQGSSDAGQERPAACHAKLDTPLKCVADFCLIPVS